MGSRVGILRALTRLPRLGLVALASTGCIDFVAPNIPGIEDRGSAALFDARITVSDSGNVRASAHLRPGLDFDGLNRLVPDPRLYVLLQVLEPDTVLRDGTRNYLASWQVEPGPQLAPITLTAPSIEGLKTPSPAIEWYGLDREGPGSIELPRGADLNLPVAEVEGGGNPMPSIRQWFLTIQSGGTRFRFGSDGVPENPIWIPWRWIPQGDTVHVRLVYTQSAVLGTQEDDYVGVITADNQLHWTVLVNGTTEPAGENPQHLPER